MIKRLSIILPLVIAVFLIGILGLDALKHYEILKRVRNEMNTHSLQYQSGLSFNLHGFSTYFDNVKADSIFIESLTLIMPWNSLGRVFVSGKNVNVAAFKARTVQSRLQLDEKDDDVSVPYLNVDDSTALGFSVNDIYGSILVNDNHIAFDVTFYQVSKHNTNIFDIILKGSVDNFSFKEKRNGAVNVTISNIKSLIRVLESEHIINSWQKGIISNMVEEGVVIPLKIKEDKLLLGPFKLYTFSF